MGSVAELFKQAAELPENERATLAGLLIESLVSEIDPDVEQAWAAEITRRLSELDSGAVQMIPWETVRSRILRRLGKP